MNLIRQWIAARWQWAWCALFGHPLTEQRHMRYTNRHGHTLAVDRWNACECGAKIGSVTRSPR